MKNKHDCTMEQGSDQRKQRRLEDSICNKSVVNTTEVGFWKKGQQADKHHASRGFCVGRKGLPQTFGKKNGEGRRSCMEKPGREEAKHPKLEVLYTVKVC